jgi:hypothetical protein
LALALLEKFNVLAVPVILELIGARSFTCPLRRPHSESKVRWRVAARDIVTGLVPGRKTRRRNGTVDIGGEIEMIETQRVFEDIAMGARTTDGRSKGIDIEMTKSGDGLVAPSRFLLHHKTANGAQSTGSETTGLLNPETAGTVSRDSRKTISTGKS